jgi:hypothetical protein
VGVYIGYVDIPSSVEMKIREKHQVTGDEVREAVQWPARAQAGWEDHPEHGLRVLALGQSYAGRVILVVLQPVDPTDGYWRLRTARARN